MPYDLTYGWNLNKQTKPKLIDTENRLVAAGGGGWGWAKWVMGSKVTNSVIN